MACKTIFGNFESNLCSSSNRTSLTCLAHSCLHTLYIKLSSCETCFQNGEDKLEVKPSPNEVLQQAGNKVVDDKSPLPSASPICDANNTVLASATNVVGAKHEIEKTSSDANLQLEREESEEKCQKPVDKDCEDDYEDDFESDTDESSKSSSASASDDDLSTVPKDVEITNLAKYTKPANDVPGKSCLAPVPSSGRANEKKKTVSFRDTLEDVRYYKIDDCPSKAGKGYFMSPFHMQEL
uniref:uncharacterized protein LOC120328605 n=1 Tax=Styela clava TaxID=7725 RepID=UPI0019398712|nr:uncharacterized protein LOC120328605 [Styela clava]